MATEAPPAGVSLLRPRDVMARLGLSKGYFYDLIKAGRLPRPVYVGTQSPRWRSDEIDRYIDRLSAERAA